MLKDEIDRLHQDKIFTNYILRRLTIESIYNGESVTNLPYVVQSFIWSNTKEEGIFWRCIEYADGSNHYIDDAYSVYNSMKGWA